MKPTFKTINEMKIVGISGKFISIMSPNKNNMEVIPALWGQFFARKAEIKNTLSEKNFGVCFEIPEAEQTDPAEMLYVAAAEVSSLDDIPAGMKGFIIPAGEYAVFTHKGVLDTIGETMGTIYGEWFPQSGKKSRRAPDFELYDSRFKLNQPDSELDIYVPVE